MTTVNIGGKEYYVRHILADGREVESLSEVTLPTGHPAYKMVLEAVERLRRKEREGT